MIASIDDAVREIDAQLTQLDEAKAARRGRVVVVESGVQEAGCCLECRAAFFEGARFCMQCGTAFAPTPTAVHESGAGDTRILATGGS